MLYRPMMMKMNVKMMNVPVEASVLPGEILPPESA